jgi:hypothetical protein
VGALLQGCPLLRETDHEYAGGISDDLRVELARRLRLTSTDFKHWTNRCSYLAQEVLKVSPNLTSVRFWIRTSDATLAVCAQHCPQLQELNLSGTRRVIQLECGLWYRRSEASCVWWIYSLVPARRRSGASPNRALPSAGALLCWSTSTIRLSERRCFDEAEGTLRTPYKAAISTTIAALNVNFLL